MKATHAPAFLRFQAIGKATLMILMFALLVSCGDDEEPSVQAMLIGSWRLVSIDGSQLESGFMFEMELEQDGDYRETYTEDGMKYSYSGEWKLHSNKKDVDIEYDDGDRIRFELISVDKEELRVEDEEGYRFVFGKD